MAAETVEEKKDKAYSLLDQARQDLMDSGDFEAALKACQKALKIYQQIQYRVGEACAINNIGIIHQYQATEYYGQALTIFKEIKSSGQQGAQDNLKAVQDEIGWLSPSGDTSVLVFLASVGDLIGGGGPVVDNGPIVG